MLDTFKKINELKEKSDLLKADCNRQVDFLNKSALALFEAYMQLSQKESVSKIIVELESSQNLTSDYDGFSIWVIIDYKKLLPDVYSDFHVELLREYFSNMGHSLDVTKDTLQNFIGPCIVINEDGDILDQDSGKWIISKGDYETISERNQLIENYLEKKQLLS